MHLSAPPVQSAAVLQAWLTCLTCMRTLQVVSKVDAEGNPFTRGAAANDWKVSQDLFPVELTPVCLP